jgi:hypothetical protein
MPLVRDGRHDYMDVIVGFSRLLLGIFSFPLFVIAMHLLRVGVVLPVPAAWLCRQCAWVRFALRKTLWH